MRVHSHDGAAGHVYANVQALSDLVVQFKTTFFTLHAVLTPIHCLDLMFLSKFTF